jgi:hypothetical protein
MLVHFKLGFCWPRTSDRTFSRQPQPPLRTTTTNTLHYYYYYYFNYWAPGSPDSRTNYTRRCRFIIHNTRLGRQLWTRHTKNLPFWLSSTVYIFGWASTVYIFGWSSTDSWIE